MSDFIFSGMNVEKDSLSKRIKAIYHEDPPEVNEFHGIWGSLAVSENQYHGYEPYETKDYLTIVIGGPILKFSHQQFTEKGDSNSATKVIYERWISGKLKWDEDLSGPFVVVFISKSTKKVICMTDMMSFIPAYACESRNNIMISTHVDALAKASKHQDKLDLVSIIDFILNGIVTYPYTCYQDIKQLQPASRHTIFPSELMIQTQAYWIPEEIYSFRHIREAAFNIRKALEEYVTIIKDETSTLAQFISGGEDSRIIAALLQDKKRDAFIFLDQMNREGKIAKKTAQIYGANFKLETRDDDHYLRVLPNCSLLGGSGSQYFHGHTYGFHKHCKLNSYSAVMGGFLSDSLLKGYRIRKMKGIGRYSFVPEIKRKDFSHLTPMDNNMFIEDVQSELIKRKRKHLQYIKTFRKESADEWFDLWPISMNLTMPNLHFNRRLFRSYEPFLDNKIVKLSAEIPQKWKLNRRVFQIAFKPYLKTTKWLFHSTGYFPYRPWYINSAVQFMVVVYRKVMEKTGLLQGNQGPWNEWKVLTNSVEWQEALKTYSKGLEILKPVLRDNESGKLFEKNSLDEFQKVNLLQVLFQNSAR